MKVWGLLLWGTHMLSALYVWVAWNPWLCQEAGTREEKMNLQSRPFNVLGNPQRIHDGAVGGSYLEGAGPTLHSLGSLKIEEELGTDTTASTSHKERVEEDPGARETI